MAESEKHEDVPAITAGEEEHVRTEHEDVPAITAGEEEHVRTEHEEAEQSIENPQQHSMIPSGSSDQNLTLSPPNRPNTRRSQPTIPIGPLPLQDQYIHHQNPYTPPSHGLSPANYPLPEPVLVTPWDPQFFSRKPDGYLPGLAPYGFPVTNPLLTNQTIIPVPVFVDPSLGPWRPYHTPQPVTMPVDTNRPLFEPRPIVSVRQEPPMTLQEWHDPSPNVARGRVLLRRLLQDVPVQRNLAHRVHPEFTRPVEYNPDHVPPSFPQTMHLMPTCQVFPWAASGQPPTRPVIVNQHHNMIAPYPGQVVHHEDRVIGIVIRQIPVRPMPMLNLPTCNIDQVAQNLAPGQVLEEIEQYEIVAYQYRNQPSMLFHHQQGQTVPQLFPGQAIVVYNEQQQSLIDRGLHFSYPVYVRQVSPTAAQVSPTAAQVSPTAAQVSPTAAEAGPGPSSEQNHQHTQQLLDQGVHFIYPIDMIRQVPASEAEEAGTGLLSELNRQHIEQQLQRQTQLPIQSQGFYIGQSSHQGQDQHQPQGFHRGQSSHQVLDQHQSQGFNSVQSYRQGQDQHQSQGSNIGQSIRQVPASEAEEAGTGLLTELNRQHMLLQRFNSVQSSRQGQDQHQSQGSNIGQSIRQLPASKAEEAGKGLLTELNRQHMQQRLKRQTQQSQGSNIGQSSRQVPASEAEEAGTGLLSELNRQHMQQRLQRQTQQSQGSNIGQSIGQVPAIEAEEAGTGLLTELNRQHMQQRLQRQTQQSQGSNIGQSIGQVPAIEAEEAGTGLLTELNRQHIQQRLQRQRQQSEGSNIGQPLSSSNCQ
ncbi:unnamed protein product [Cochlearia groenlandica]